VDHSRSRRLDQHRLSPVLVEPQEEDGPDLHERDSKDGRIDRDLPSSNTCRRLRIIKRQIYEWVSLRVAGRNTAALQSIHPCMQSNRGTLPSVQSEGIYRNLCFVVKMNKSSSVQARGYLSSLGSESEMRME
jgi:hypothetical protein